MKQPFNTPIALMVALLLAIGCVRSKEPVGPSALRGRIVFTQIVNRVPQLFILHPDDPRNPERVLNSLTEDLAPKWSPDGTRIAFLSDREGLAGFRRLYSVGDDGINIRGLFDPVVDPEGDLEFSWSPDGNHMAIVNNVRGFRTDRRQLFILDVYTLVRQRVADALPNRYAPDWSPNGSRIAFLTGRTDRPGAILNLLSYPGLVVSTVDLGMDRVNFPRWSPDGSRLAFLGSPGVGANYQVYVAEGPSLISRQVSYVEGGMEQPAPVSCVRTAAGYSSPGPATMDSTAMPGTCILLPWTDSRWVGSPTTRMTNSLPTGRDTNDGLHLSC